LSGKKIKKRVDRLTPTQMVILEVSTQQCIAMSKSTNFTGQPLLNQLLLFLDKGKIRKIVMHYQSDRYVKKFSTYNHVVVMLFLAF
jgi:hypothetical protein